MQETGPSSRDQRAGSLASRCCATLFTVLLTLASCAPTVPPPGKTARPRPQPGYVARVDELQSVDASALAGARIALDPGHGGYFKGALGVKGLTEAEVNLGVALNLQGLLEARGAQVFLTRSDDRDFLSPADSSLRSDLTERIRLANAFHPDLFVSIHHNADAGGLHDVNEIQTYYKLGDEGPSLDAAQSVHRYLVRNLGIEAHRIMPGNYHVLRNSEAPGLLTESSYITNPDVESKLALAAKQRLEAEALYLGLAHYFARRAPKVAEFEASAAAGGAADTVFRGIAAPVLRARVEGAFDGFALTLDGVPLAGTRRGAELEWRPDPLAAGRHEASLEARLAGRGAGREQRLIFRMERAAMALSFEPGAPALGPEGGVTATRILVADDQGQPWADSVWVRVVAADRGAVTPADTTVLARDGVAWHYAFVKRGAKPAPGTKPSPLVLRAWLVPAEAPRAEAHDGRVANMQFIHEGANEPIRFEVMDRDAAGHFLIQDRHARHIHAFFLCIQNCLKCGTLYFAVDGNYKI